MATVTTTIGVDERAREHATMLDFGLPPRTVLGMTTVETVLVGAAGTAVGVLGGYGPAALDDRYHHTDGHPRHPAGHGVTMRAA